MRRAWIAVLGLAAVAAALRFATLDRQSYWLDELVTVSLLRLDFGEMLDAVPDSEATPYLYYVLAWLWSQPFGLGEVGLRSLSALAGVALVPVAYGAGTVLVSRPVGLAASALVTVNPFLVWYSQEARSYSLLALLAACSLLFFGRALSGPSAAVLAGWAVFSSLALATHYFAMFLIVPEAIWLVLRRPRPATVVAALVPAMTLLAHLPLLLEQRGAASAVAGTALARRIAGIPKGLLVGFSFPAEVAGSLAAAALVVVGLIELVRRASAEARRKALVPGALALAVGAIPTVLGLAGADYIVVRNTIVAIVPAAIFVATGFVASRLGLAAGVALAALSLAIVVSVAADTRYGRTDWRGAAERLEATDVPRAIVVTPYLGRALWSPYLPGLVEPGPAPSRVQEIAVVGLATEGGFSGGAVRPPVPAVPPEAPPGFALVESERTGTYTLFRYRSAAPRPAPTDVLAAMRLADDPASILIQRRSEATRSILTAG